MLFYMFQLQPYADLHFSTAGWLGTESLSGRGEMFRWSFISWIAPGFIFSMFWLTLMVSITLFTLGFKTRLFGFLSWISLVSLWHRNPLILDGDDAILRLTLLYLLASPCGNALALDAWNKSYELYAPVWPLRLIQCQLSLLYFVSGWTKFTSSQWLDGSILQMVLAHPQYSRWDFSYWANRTWLKNFWLYLCHAIRWWEVLFPVLLLQRHSRCISLGFGLLFHLGLMLFMHLRLFPLIMLVLYCSWLPNTWFKKL